MEVFFFFFRSLYFLVDEDIYLEDALILKQDLSWWVSRQLVFQNSNQQIQWNITGWLLDEVILRKLVYLKSKPVEVGSCLFHIHWISQIWTGHQKWSTFENNPKMVYAQFFLENSYMQHTVTWCVNHQWSWTIFQFLPSWSFASDMPCACWLRSWR